MKKYIVAIYDQSEGENKMYAVQADNDVEAAKKALMEHSQPEYLLDGHYAEWVNGLGDNIEDVINGAWQSDLRLAYPHCIFN